MTKKLPPYSTDAEQSVIGSVLIDNTSLIEAVSIIDSNDFYNPDLRLIYEHMLKLYKSEKSVDLVTLGEIMSTSGSLDAIGGVGALAKLALAVPTSAHVIDYAMIVKKTSHERKIQRWAIDLQAATYEQKLELLQNMPAAAMSRHQHRKMSDLIRQNIADVVERYNGIDDIRGLRTGFMDLDRLTDGLKKGEVVGLWADSNVGKSIIASDIARHVAKKFGSVCYFAYEMSATDMSYRVLADETHQQIDVFNKPKANFTPETKKAIEQYDEHGLDSIHIFAEDLDTFTVAEIENYIRLYDDLKLIIVDYLHLMEPGAKADKTIDKPAIVARELKRLARKYGIPILALMSQTKGSQDTSLFVGTNELKHAVDQLWRLERDHENGDKIIRQTAHIYVVKGRGNAKGRVTLTYLEDYLTFKDCEKHAY